MKTHAHFTEIYLHKPDSLAKLEPFKIKAWWANRSWHPVVRMYWNAGTSSNGEGRITYPDGSIHDYELTYRP